MRSLHPTVPTRHVTQNGRHWFQIYGKLFEFDMGDVQSRAEAKQTADQYGAEHQAALSAKLKRPLTMREQLNGKIDRPAPPPRGPEPCGESQFSGHSVEAILAKLYREAERPMTLGRREQVERRIKMYERLQSEWATRQKTIEANERLPEAVDHARTTLDLLNRDPEATPEARIAAEDRLRALEAKGPAQDYWQSCQDWGVSTPALASDGLPVPAETPTTD